MSRRLIDDLDSSWLTDRGALYTLFILHGAQVGDEIVIESLDGRERHIAEIFSEADVRLVCSEYANPDVASPQWRIVGWRRPKK